MIRASLVPVLLVVGLTPALLAQKPITVEASFKRANLTDRKSPPPVAPLSESVTLSQKVPAGFTAPAGLADAWYGTATLGKSKVTVYVAKSDAGLDLPDLMGLDMNADGKIADAEQMAIDVAQQDVRGTKVTRSQPVEAEISIGGATIATTASFMQAGDRDPTVSLVFPGYLEAKAEVGGAERIVAIVDKDYDGKFGTAGDMWALCESGKTASPYGLSGMGERCFENGMRIGIQVTGNTVKVATEKADGPDPKDADAQRERVEKLWSDRFDAERESFIAQRKLDTSRPVATKPVQWNYVTLDEALALGKKSGKPVFIDVMAFWCVWCYRMDYYTYPDKQVADMLNNDFIAVKIIQEQDRSGDYDKLMKEKLEARGIPAMGIFDGDGNVLHKISGWKSPEDFVKDLEAGKAKK